MFAKESADIQVANIEEELSKFKETNGGKSQIKACLFNLIAYAIDSTRANYIAELIHTIIEKFPCRIIFIKADAEASHDYLHTEVSIVSSQQGKTVIACDQIAINVSKSQLHRVPFLILPHLVPDLPIYLLWGQNPIEENQILPKIQQYATRLIFDPECSENLQLFSKNLLEKIDSFHNLELMDINWALISNWREILAQIFNTPEKIYQLNASKSINIVYNDHKTEFLKHPEIRANYLQGWLATQFQWKFIKCSFANGKRIITYSNKDSQDITVTLCPKIHTDLPTGAIIEIEVATKDNHFCVISLMQKLSQVVVHASTLEKCELPFTLTLPNIHRGFSFMKEIFYYPMSNHYRQMLETISQIEYCSSKG